MGCLCTKNSIDVAPVVSQKALRPHQVPHQAPSLPPQALALPQGTDEQEKDGERMPRGNIAVYSKYLKKFQRLLKQGSSAKDEASPMSADDEAFPLQENVLPEDLTPWRDEDTRIICPKVKERNDPYFWNFSKDAEKKADEVFRAQLTPWRNGATSFVGLPYLYYSGTTYANGATFYTGGKSESVNNYFQSQLRHPPGQCDACINLPMNLELTPWNTLPVGVIAEDLYTSEQAETIASRERRSDMEDRERMRKRRVFLIRRLLRNKEAGENEMLPWLGWADRMEQSWKRFQQLVEDESQDRPHGGCN